MASPKPRIRADFGIFQLLPNMLTVAAICAGMSAIRFGVQGNYVLAVQLILAACVLDGLDGRLARRMGSDSKMGAELDSLADFLNFGVAPPLVLYFWALQDMRDAAWISVLVYTVCCVVRLARFNVIGKSEDSDKAQDYFIGVPSPAGALLVLFPMFISFGVIGDQVVPGLVICIHMVAIGLLMISHIPIWTFKTLKISRENVKYFLVAFAFVGTAVLTFAWITLAVLCLAYVGLVAWAMLSKNRIHAGKGD